MKTLKLMPIIFILLIMTGCPDAADNNFEYNS